MKRGDTVKITGGIWKGYSASVESVDGDRVKVWPQGSIRSTAVKRSDLAK